ncbi:MAG: hypothetical protein OEV73_07285 [Desulfobulbaceae bacterium]|nr:hypothetical protein [Desulfobulbaceae bacterium]
MSRPQPATTEPTSLACATCGRPCPPAALFSQGGSGDICPDCRAELASCGCGDED